MNILFRNKVLNTELSRYGGDNGNNSLRLFDGEDLYMICSVNPTVQISLETGQKVKLERDEIAIKDYSENEGILQCLIDNKIVSEPIDSFHSGYVIIPICKLLINQ